MELMMSKISRFSKAIVLHKATLPCIGAYCLFAKAHMWQVSALAKRQIKQQKCYIYDMTSKLSELSYNRY